MLKIGDRVQTLGSPIRNNFNGRVTSVGKDTVTCAPIGPMSDEFKTECVWNIRDTFRDYKPNASPR
jgi:hypothetical protein